MNKHSICIRRKQKRVTPTV